MNAVDEHEPASRFRQTERSTSAAAIGGRARTGWKETLVSGEMSVKRQSSSRSVGTVSTPTRSTASARKSVKPGERDATSARQFRGRPASRPVEIAVRRRD